MNKNTNHKETKNNANKTDCECTKKKCDVIAGKMRKKRFVSMKTEI